MAESPAKRMRTQSQCHHTQAAPVVVLGIGQLGATFAKGFLRMGRCVIPVIRGQSLEESAEHHPDPELVVVSVSEKEFKGVLQSMPAKWKGKLVLLQNDLHPQDWKECGIQSPTICVLWYQQTQHSALTQTPGVLTTIYGPKAELVATAHRELGIECRVTYSEQEMLDSLIAKNVLILVINICALTLPYKQPYLGGTFEQFLCYHRDLFDEMANDAMAIQEGVVGVTLAPAKKTQVLNTVLRMMRSCLNHPNSSSVGRGDCDGRSYLKRSLELADRLNIAVPAMRRVWKERRQLTIDVESPSKGSVREMVWAELSEIARLNPKYGTDFSKYIPDFEGSELCAERIVGLLPVASDKVQLFLTPSASLDALSQKLQVTKTTFLMASKGLQKGIFSVTEEWKSLAVEDLQRMAQSGPLEIVVIGVAAVSEAGKRLGGGCGYFDIEWGLLSELKLVSPTTDIIAIAHDCQVVSGTWQEGDHDTPIDLIVTPTRIIRTGAKKTLGRVVWESLNTSIAATPLFQQMKKLKL